MSELQRGSVFAIVQEDTVGVLKEPTSGSDFIPLKSGFTQTTTIEQLENDEILNDIGATQSLTGLEEPKGEHPAYLKNSEVEGTPPETALLFKSAFGIEYINGTQYNTGSSSTPGSATARAVVNAASGTGVNFHEGQALLIKDPTNGYNIRNVYSIATDALGLNFNLAAAPASGIGLGKATQFTGTATGQPSFSAWVYGGNGGYIQAVAGAKTTSIKITLDAAKQATVDFSYSGTEAFWNPIEITSTTQWIDFVDSAGTLAVSLTNKIYKTPIALAAEIATKMDGASADTITCAYDSQTGKFTIASNGSTLSLLFLTGTHHTASADSKIGFTHTDHTSALTYASDTAVSWAAGFTPVYDNATNIVAKASELFIGDFSDNLCRCFSTVSLTVTIDTENVECGCAVSGLAEILATKRTALLEATLVFERNESALFDKFVNNKSVAVMANIGPKDSSGNWIPGKAVNMYMPQATITQHDAGGDTIVELKLSCQGYLTGTKKDLHLNFV